MSMHPNCRCPSIDCPIHIDDRPVAKTASGRKSILDMTKEEIAEQVVLRDGELFKLSCEYGEVSEKFEIAKTQISALVAENKKLKLYNESLGMSIAAYKEDIEQLREALELCVQCGTDKIKDIAGRALALNKGSDNE